MEETYYKNKNTTRTIFNFSVIFAILLIAFSVFYYLVIFPSQKNEKQLQQQINLQEANNTQKISNQQKLSTCLDEVNKRVSSPQFQEALKNTKLNSADAKVVLDAIAQQKEECYKRYPQ